MLALDLRALRRAHAPPPRPKAREGEQRSVLAYSEPSRRLAGSGRGVFAERCRWYEASVPRRKPAASVRACDVADVGDRLAAKLQWSRHAPARHDQFALTIPAV